MACSCVKSKSIGQASLLAVAARSARGSRGSFSTRSPMMFFWISVEPE